MCSITEYTMYKICETFNSTIGKTKEEALSQWSFGAIYAMRANLKGQTPAEFIDRMIAYGHLANSGDGSLILSETGESMLKELRARVEDSDFSDMEIYKSNSTEMSDAPVVEL
ncbi:MAG: hypothetical protein AB2765_07885 [Candidatus Thiodiazotropha endolucinida]